MKKNYYDVLVVGPELGPLAAGALLAKRGFRVLVVGQNAPRDRYTCFGFTFAHRPFALYNAESPAIRRIVAELGIGQVFQRLVRAESPAYQVVMPRCRIDVHRHPKSTESEIARELPEAAAAAGPALAEIGRLSGEIGKLLDNDLVIPPETFFERRELARAEVQNPFRTAQTAPAAAEIDSIRRFADFLEAPFRFETGGAPSLPLVRFRQLGGWLFDCAAVEGGRDALVGLLVDQIVGHGGDFLPRQRIGEIEIHKERVTGVRLAGWEEATGCKVVLVDMAPHQLRELVPPKDWPKRFLSLVEDAPRALLRFGVNLGVSRAVVPAGLAGRAFLRFGPGLEDDLLWIEQVPQADPGKAALHVSCVLRPERAERIASGALRDAILDRVRGIVPFLDKHLEVLHSPYDGFGPLDLTGRAAGGAPPVPHPEEIPRWLLNPPHLDGLLGVESYPYRTGIKGLLFAGRYAVAGLGFEGEMIAAWGAARIAAKMDPRRERLVKAMRAKVEV